MKCLFTSLFAMALLACGGDSSTAATASIAGTWNLKTINGAPLPFTLTQGGSDKVEIVSDVLTISGTGSFTQTATERTTQNGQSSVSSVVSAGAYTLNGTAVTFTFSDGSVDNGSWSGNTITVTVQGGAFVFTR